MSVFTYKGVDFAYTLRHDSTIRIERCGRSRCISIPEEIDGLPVTEIAPDFLRDMDGVKEVVFPDTIKIIGKNALYACYDLEKVKLPEKIEYIPKDFCSLTSLMSLTIPDSVKVIEDGAFGNIFDLKELVLGKGVEKIGLDTFSVSVVKTLHIGPNVKEIKTDDSRGFMDGNSYLKEITVDKNNPNFRDVNGVLFSKDLTELIRYPSAKEEKHYEMPNQVKRISSKAFGHASLESLKFGKSVEEVKDNILGFEDRENFTVYCLKESLAEEFAKRKGYNIKYTESDLTKFLNDIEEDVCKTQE